MPGASGKASLQVAAAHKTHMDTHVWAMDGYILKGAAGEVTRSPR